MISIKPHLLFIVGSLLVTYPIQAELIYKAPSKKLLENQKLYLEETVPGFGKEVPLHLVLELVRGTMPVSIEDGLTLNSLVTWDGEVSRKKVLNDVLLPRNLSWSISEGSLNIQKRTLNGRLRNVVSSIRFPIRNWKVKEGDDARALISEWARLENILIDWPSNLPSAWLGPERDILSNFPDALETIMEVVVERNKGLVWSLDEQTGFVSVNKE